MIVQFIPYRLLYTMLYTQFEYMVELGILILFLYVPGRLVLYLADSRLFLSPFSETKLMLLWIVVYYLFMVLDELQCQLHLQRSALCSFLPVENTGTESTLFFLNQARILFPEVSSNNG